MRAAFIAALICLLPNLIFAQPREFDIALGDFVFTVKRDVLSSKSSFSPGVIKICTEVKVHPANFPDTNNEEEKDSVFCSMFNNDDITIFKNSIAAHIKSIKGEDFYEAHKAVMESLLDLRYPELIKSIDYTEFEFGRDLYFGLSDDELARLEQRKSILNDMHTAYNAMRIFLRSRGKEIKDKYKERLKELANTTNVSKNETKGSENSNEGDQVQQNVQKENNDYIDSIILLNRSIKLEKANIKALLNKRKYQVALIGNASSVSSFKTVDQTELNAGFGIRAFKPAHAEFFGLVTIAQARDTVIGKVEDFGESVLIPGVRRFSLLASYRMTSFDPVARSPFLRKWGGAINVNVTPYNWVIKKLSTPDEDSVVGKVIPAAFDLLLSYNWLSVYEEGKDISISTDIGFTGRILAGDLTPAERGIFLGNTTKFYGGLNMGINIRYNSLRVLFYCPFLFNEQVKGLTGGQVYASIGFIGSIINSASSIIKKKKNEPATSL